MLWELQEPTVSYSVGYQEMTASDFDKAAIGKRLRMVYPEIGETVDTFITEIKRDYEDAARSSLVVANKETSIASSLADMADRQRIEQTYAQGATQIYSQALQANCDAASGAVMDFFIPEEMRIINKVLVKVRMTKFRAYSRSTESDVSKVITSTTNDDQTRTSSDGGGTKATSSDGGETRTTSSSGGDSQTTSGGGGGGIATSSSGGGSSSTSGGGGGSTTDTGNSGINVVYGNAQTEVSEGHVHMFRSVIAHQHRVTLQDHIHTIHVPDHSHDVNIPSHSHNVTIPGHRHDVSIPNHRHNVTIPDHRHTITIPGHSHKVTVPSHSHNITPGIYQYGNPQKFGLYINGTKKADFSGRTAELDITDLLTGSDNMIPRGSWLSLEVRPDDLAYISIDLIIQGFIQSRGDKTV